MEGLERVNADVVGLPQRRTRLASYKAPRRVLFFSEADLTLTGSAKVKTADLRGLVAKTLAAQAPNDHPILQRRP